MWSVNDPPTVDLTLFTLQQSPIPVSADKILTRSFLLAVHEKIFITFMVTSLTYMLVSLRLYKVLQPNGPVTNQEQRSVYYKKMWFAMSIASTIGLIVFFLKHRLLCHDLAFSWFAFCEYLIAFSNMGFHCTTTMIDFPAHLNLLVSNVNGNLTIAGEAPSSKEAKKD